MATQDNEVRRESGPGFFGHRLDYDDGSQGGRAEAVELPGALERPAETELILRLLRGEALDAVSRESQVPAHELEAWKRVFLEQGREGSRLGAIPRNASSRWRAPRSAN